VDKPLISAEKKRNRRAVLGAGGFAHFIHDGFTDTLYVLLPLWAEAFGLSHAQVGALKMAASGTLAAFQVPAGLLAEKIGERWVLVLGTVLAGGGFLLLGLAGGFIGLLLCLVVMGLGCSTQHPLASAVVSKAYEGGGRRAALGTYNFTGDLGKVAIPVSVATVSAAYGWKTGAMGYGAAGIVAALVIFFLLGRLKVGASKPKSVQDPHTQPATKGWGISDVRGFFSLSAIGVIDSSARLAFLTFVPFLLMGKGAAVEGIGFALALIFAGGAAGKLICGHIAERVGILRTVVLTELATGGGILLLVSLPLDGAMILLPFLGVALNGTSSVLYGTMADFVDPDRQARAFGLFYTLGVGAGAVAPLIYGLISDRWGVDVTLNVLALSVFLVLPMCLVLKPRLSG
jgi:MFS transporter, FSR family, fosmidomycin resistance protein